MRITAAQPAGPPRKLIGPIRFCTRDCPDARLAGRLRARPSWRASSSTAFIAEHQRFAAWLRANIAPCYDTSVLTPAETAGRIAGWISQHIPAPAPEPGPGN